MLKWALTLADPGVRAAAGGTPLMCVCVRARARVRELCTRCQRIPAAQWRREKAALRPTNAAEELCCAGWSGSCCSLDPEAMEVAPAASLLLCVSLRLSLAHWEFGDTHFPHVEDAIDYKDPCKAGRMCLPPLCKCW